MILMTKTNAIPAGALLVAIDVAKHRNAVLIEPAGLSDILCARPVVVIG